MKLIRKLSLVLFSFILFFGLSNIVRAQEAPISISVSPPTFEVSANPGDNISNVIRVQNTSDRLLTITTEKRNFTAVGDEGEVGLTEDDTQYSLAKWVTVTPEVADINPGETFTFAYTIEIPSNAEPGGHFGSIIFRTSALKEADKVTGTSVAQEVGSLLLVKLSGNVKEKLRMDSFSPKETFYEYGPVDFEMKFTNTGNVHIKPVGNVIITDVFGNKVANIGVETRNVLPSASRRMEAKWDKKLLFGKYTAVATLNYGSDKDLLTATSSFTVIPYKIVTGAFFALIVVLYILFKMRKRLGKALKVLFSK